MTPLESLRARLDAGETAEALAPDIQAAVAARRQQPGEHTAWALLCEQAGLMSLAFSEFQLALRDDRRDETATLHLAQHYRERGDADRALKLLERLVDRDPARDEWLAPFIELLAEEGAFPRVAALIDRAQERGLPAERAQALRAAWLPRRGAAVGARAKPAVAGSNRSQPVEAPGVRFAPTDADCIRMHTLFSGREGVYARQWARPGGETGYAPVHEPLTPAVIKQHFSGQFTVGVYPLRLDGTVTFFAIDLDIDKSALQHARTDPDFGTALRESLSREGPRLLAALGELGFTPLFENSGYKGRHYWVFLAEPAAAEAVHLLGRLFVAWQAPQLAAGMHLEFFPRQATLKGKGLGNLIKLPLGIHRRTGRRSLFLDDRSQPLADQLAALRAARPLGREAFYAAIDRLKALAPGAPGGSTAAASAASDEPAPWEDAGGHRKPNQPLPAPPPPAPIWTEADFESDPRVRHLLAECPVLAEIKRTVDDHRRLSHEEQLVLIHSLGHVAGGPQAVNYLLHKCVDVGPEKLMKDRLKGNPVSCPSIRKKIPHITRRVACCCPFEFAADRYPTPVLHLLTLPEPALPPAALPGTNPAGGSSGDATALAERFNVLDRKRLDLEREWGELRAALVRALALLPDPRVACGGGHYRLEEHDGVERLVWRVESESTTPSPPVAAATVSPTASADSPPAAAGGG